MADNPPPKWTTDDPDLHTPGETTMDIDQDAEQARNSAAQALNDLANAAVVVSSSTSGGTLGSSSVASSLVNDPPRQVAAMPSAEAAAAAAKQKRRPAALLTPTRRAGGGKNSHLTPNAAGQSARRSPLVAGETYVGEMEGTAQDGGPVSPNERTGDKGKGGYNSPFTTQPFVSRGICLNQTEQH